MERFNEQSERLFNKILDLLEKEQVTLKTGLDALLGVIAMGLNELDAPGRVAVAAWFGKQLRKVASNVRIFSRSNRYGGKAMSN
jgi:hypothetical protein